MALRLVEIYLPEDRKPSEDWASDHGLMAEWAVRLEDEGHLIRALIDSELSEAFLDRVEQDLGGLDGSRIVILPVEATLPRQSEEQKEEDHKHKDKTTNRVSREELYADVSDAVGGTQVYYVLVLLSAVVAAAGMMRDDVAVVIGAMVIAPLLGPNIALALGTTLADRGLITKSLRVNALGLLAALGLSIIIGLLIDFSPTVDQIASRTYADLGTVVLALAAGVAGALSMTLGLPTALVGVMVAVALLPPLVALGMLMGAGYWFPAAGAGLLLLVNIAAINLSAVITFIVQGVRPTSWDEAEEAKRSSRFAVILWLAVLAALIVLVLLSPESFIPDALRQNQSG